MNLHPRLFAAMACVLVLDQVTKSWAVSTLNGGHVVHVIGSLQFNLGFNSGIAFSQAQNMGALVGIIGVVAIAFLVRAMLRAPNLAAAYGFAAISSGALGNLIDRIFRGDGWLHGRVVDFIDLQWFPVFNVADSAITIGAVALILSMVRDYVAEKQKNMSDEG